MQRKFAIGCLGLWLGWSGVSADVSEMIFYPQADFSEAIFHFNYQGEKHKNYGFMFEKGFDPDRIVYVRPTNYAIGKTKEGMTKLSFENTDRYSYLQRAFKDDFLVSEENGIVKILLSGGDCKSSPDCVTAENILTVNVPKGYGVRKYQGLDQDLKPLKNPKWDRKGNTFTLTARDVKGACVMMELEKLKPGQSITPVAVAKPAVVTEPVIEAVAVKEVPAVPKIDKANSGVPAPYFRNFQIFESRVVALSEVGKERLREWARLYKTGGYTSVTINGYTDNIPPQRLKALYATNEILSEARAQMVADYLVSIGIEKEAIKVVGMGDANPVASNENEEGRSKNRRIEFVLSR